MILNIKHLMGDLGLTQNDIANIIGEYQSVVSLFVQGKRYPMDRHIEALEKAYGKDVVAKYFVEEADIDFNIGRTERVELKRLMGDFDLSQRQIAEIMGTTQSEVSQLSNGNRKFMRKHTDALIAHFGQEVIDKYTLPTDAYEPKSRVATVTILKPDIIEEAKEQGREEVRQQMGSDVVPFLPNEYITRPDFDIRDYVQCNGGELEHIDPRNLVAGAQLCFRVLKPSMASILLPGDKVFVRFLPKGAELISGDIYFIDTPARGVMIRKVEVMGNEIKLIASNPGYADIVLHREREVYSVAVIIGVFREFLSDSQFDINAIYKRKDEQIERVLNLQGDLVAEIREQSKRNNALVDKIINKDN